MAENQQSMFGHKVIFLNPDFPGHGEVFRQLREDEYEFYFVEDFRDAKNVLREFKDSICFVFADESVQKRKTINFILSCAADESLKSTIFYTLTSDLDSKEKKALKGASPCYEGMIKLNPKTFFLVQDIEGKLEEKNAKGRRQYVRVSCSADKSAVALAQLDGCAYKLKMHDISIVGSACSIEPKFSQFFEKGTVIPTISFSLAGRQIWVGGVTVYGIFPADGAVKLVLLFKKPLVDEDKSFVHRYIGDKFEDAVDTIIKIHPKDESDYTKDFGKDEDK